MKKNEFSGFYSHFKKLLFIMRLVILGLFLGLTSISASTYSQITKLSLDMKGVTILDVFAQVESQSEFVFIYKNETIDLNKKVNISVKETSVEKILQKVLRDVGAKYEIIDKQIIVTKERSIPESDQVVIQDKPAENVTEMAQPQRREIKGTIKDKNGQSLIGVNVVIKGTTIGTITDVNGNYMLLVPDDAKTLVFSFIGMDTQEIALTAENTYNIVLAESFTGIEELVVVGYGSQKKQSIVGAIVQASSDELKRNGGVTNLAQALTGNLPGVTTMIASGEPGDDDPRILIRAQGTWNNSSPLVLVDGVERKMNDIDISEIESVSVLKDASATAVFGVKGAEGVILITSKRGKVGKPKLSFDANVSTKAISKFLQKHDSYSSLVIRNTAIERELGCLEAGWGRYTRQDQLANYLQPKGTLIPSLVAQGITDIRYEDVFPNVDWYKESIKDFALSHRFNLNISGGTNFASYFGSLSYTHDGDLMATGKDVGRGYANEWAYDRFNYRTNLDFNLTSTTILTVNLSGYVGIKTQSPSSSGGESMNWVAFTNIAPNVFPPRFLDGTWGYNPTTLGNQHNPIRNINTRGTEKVYRSQVNTDFALKQKLDFITDGLSLQGSLAYDNLFYSAGGIYDPGVQSKYISPGIIDKLPSEPLSKYVQYSPATGIYDYAYVSQPPQWYAEYTGTEAFQRNDQENSFRHIFYQVQLNYARTFGKHDIGSTFLMNREQSATGSMFPRYREDWVGRLTYNYDQRYLFETNGAYNGSEKFAPKYRFGFFPSVAFGWMASNENFLKTDWLNKLKFRYSVGKVGNDNLVSVNYFKNADPPPPDVTENRWAYETNWALDGNTTPYGYPVFAYSPYSQYIETGIGNPDLQWEVSKKQNFGFEMAVLNNRFNLNVDYFTDDRSNIFLDASQRNIAPYFGAAPVAANLGKTKTRGYEIEFKFQNTTKSMLNYWFTWAYTHAKDEVIYKEDPELLPAYQKQAGFQMGQLRNQLHDGYLNNWDEVYGSVPLPSGNNLRLPGDLMLLDFNADGVINNFDNAPYGYPERPQNTYNFTFGLDYKGFSIMAQFYGVFNATRALAWTMRPFSDANQSVVYDWNNDAWAPDNLDATWKSLRFGASGSSTFGAAGAADGLLGVTDASYLRLKTAEIAYALPKNWIKSLGLASARIYLNGNNIWLWSQMPDDREANDLYRYPTYKRFNLGINLDF